MLQAWLDGELSEAQAEQMRLLAAADPDAARLLAELRLAKAAVLEHERLTQVPESREFYWSKIERQIRAAAVPQNAANREAQDRVWPLLWRRWFSPLAAVAAVAAVLLVALNQPAPDGTLDNVSTTADGLEARTIRDKSTGMTIVFLQETDASPSEAAPQAARTREDGSSFNVELE